MVELKLNSLEELLDYYKGRYQAGSKMDMTQKSKYYSAFQEIELRYRALAHVVDYIQDLYLKDSKNREKQSYKNVLVFLHKFLALDWSEKKPKLPEKCMETYRKGKEELDEFCKNLEEDTYDAEFMMMDFIQMIDTIVRCLIMLREANGQAVCKKG